jgi:methylthioribose-1-phosphate isomerase
MVRPTELRPVALEGDAVVVIDQRRLPARLVYLRLATYPAVIAAIKTLAVRGAPAIGVAGAYALVLAADAAEAAGLTGATWMAALAEAGSEIAAARPTAVNLSWAVDRLLAVAAQGGDCAALRQAAVRIELEDRLANEAIGRFGAELLGNVRTVLTHCNAGALATAGYGTALGIVRALHARGTLTMVYATETRPLQQGLRLTTWELQRDGIPVTLIADSAAAWLMAQGTIDACVVGADRIAANGDVANKIGTYGIAIAAARHSVPFYVAAPLSTLDRATPSGAAIPVEERSSTELTHYRGRRIAPRGVSAANLAFDVTPATLVTAIITEAGIIKPPGLWDGDGFPGK